ncbi:MAG: aspartate-semialdehyde dehydrogenase [Acidimicrobiales bacterium]|nr:MAG: aspartate-semialdehyde dehydrogenase [Acidimicrobiales bacterium]
MGVNVGVVGATGQVGRLVLDILDERGFPVDRLRCFASPRSAGLEVLWRDRSIVVEDATRSDWSGLDVVIMSAGKQASRELAPEIAGSGAVVIDNSSAWRLDPDVPLVVTEVNPEALERRPKGIVANPNCTTMVAMPVLAPLHRAAGLRAVVASSYQAVSGAGRRGNDELARQLEKAASRADDLLRGDGVSDLEAAVFAKPIAFNVVPFAGSLLDDGSGETDEERKLRDETRKILAAPHVRVSATCVRVPVWCGHSLALTADFDRSLEPDEARRLLEKAPGVRVTECPTPLEAAGGDVTLVGRIKRDEVFENGLSLFLSGDNLRKGAALNAVQIAELIVEK